MSTQNFGTSIKQFFMSKSSLSTVMAICIMLWAMLGLTGMIEYLFELHRHHLSDTILPWIAMSSDITAVLYHPWTIVSYMFVHQSLFHLLWNMVMLYFAGTMVTHYMGERRMLKIFLWSGVAGAMLYLGCYNIFPVFRHSTSQLIGCSAGALGLFFAAAAHNPNEPVSIWPFRTLRFPMIGLAFMFLLLDFLTIPRGNSGGHIAHIGGSICGYLMVWCQQRQVFGGVQRFFASLKPKPKQKKKQRNPHMESHRGGRPMSDDEYNRRQKEEQARIDAILDKISASGYASLTKEEKDTLFNFKTK